MQSTSSMFVVYTFASPCSMKVNIETLLCSLVS